MLLFNITKRINKTVAPKFLSISLRLHEYLSSSSSLPFSPNVLSLLPLAQRLTSIEVQDDYRQLKYNADNNNNTKSAWENFVDDTWSLFFEEGHERSQKAKRNRDEQMVEAEAQRLYEMKQLKRRKRQNQKIEETRLLRMNENDTIHKNELAKSGEDRVQLLEQYIRPALCTGNYKNRHIFTHHYDEHRQSTYDNFVKWIRGEYLIAKYGHIVQEAIQQYPTLRDDAAGLSTLEVEQATMKKDTIVPLQLPSVNTVRSAFDMQDWTRYKVPISTWEDDNVEVNDANNETESASIQQIIHNKLHGQIAHSGPLNAFFEMRRREDSYELWTRDYIFGLAQYLHDRVIEMDHNRTPGKETIILDVGAGDGRLAYFLRRAMRELQFEHIPTIIATDDGSWRAPIYNNQYIQVEKLSAIDSLKKYGPKRNDIQNDRRDDAVPRRLIVLCSWMPPAIDWTADFRQPVNETKGGGTSNDDDKDDHGIEVERLVEEYILIGEADDGTCGHNWYTWGNFDFHTENVNEVLRSRKTPYEMDGYMRVDLDDLSMLQFSRFDCKRSSESMTVSFRHERGK